MFKIKRSTRVRPGIDFTPLIDCAFTMIIFFAVSMTLISARTGMKMNVPEKTTVEPMPKQVQISIKQTDTGYQLYYKDMPIVQEGLANMVKNELALDSAAQFIIAAEPGVVYDSVIRVVDIVNESGGKKLALQLNQKTNEKETEKPQ
jgi:biopolymer transport protein ExbD